MKCICEEILAFIRAIRQAPNEEICEFDGQVIVGNIELPSTPHLMDFIWELVGSGILRTISLTDNVFEMVVMLRGKDIVAVQHCNHIYMKRDRFNFRCDICGRFIAFADILDKKAVHQMTMPDCHFGPETWETYHVSCENRKRSNYGMVRG